jgi:hypothetical protein
MAADVKIDIAAEFTGKKAFKQADTATQKLTNNVKKLAGSFGVAFGATALAAYSKAAVKAFAEDEAAALRLNRAVENLGIGFANPAIADYIAKLERSAGVADDILRPAFQGLLTTTGSLTQSQKLLSDAITISRASGIDLATVTEDLGRGYIGITKGLTKYNTGLTKAELNSMSFNDILGTLLKRSAGAAEDYLDTTAYKMDVLGLATGNASEIIGQGFVDALARAAGGTEASDAQIFLETMAGLFNKVTLAAGTSVGAIPTLAQNLKKLGKDIFMGFAGKQVGVNLAIPPKKEELKLTLSQRKQAELLAKFEKDALRRERERLALKNKQLAADKAKAIIAKGEVALGKGTNVFDIEKIQLLAAEKNQVEQIGKATSQAQLLAITGDLARIQVKKDIIALEDAIASKDEKAIIAATNKLNEDLKILGVLTKQDIKLVEIKSTLEDIVPKDLIDIANLDEAIAKLKLISEATAKATITSAAAGTDTAKLLTNSQVNELLVAGSFVPVVAGTGGVVGGSTTAGAYASSGFPGADKNNGTTVLNVTNNFGVVGDPNSAAEVITDIVRQAVDRGTLRAS